MRRLVLDCKFSVDLSNCLSIFILHDVSGQGIDSMGRQEQEGHCKYKKKNGGVGVVNLICNVGVSLLCRS